MELGRMKRRFFSQRFVIPQESGKPRWVVGLHRLNKLLWPWVRGLAPILCLVRNVPAEWRSLSVVDFDNGVLNVPLKPPLRPFFCVVVRGRRLMFSRLPYVWNCSAGLFHDIVCKTLEIVPGVISCMDDIFSGPTSTGGQHRIVKMYLYTLEPFGFHENVEKSNSSK